MVTKGPEAAKKTWAKKGEELPWLEKGCISLLQEGRKGREARLQKPN